MDCGCCLNTSGCRALDIVGRPWTLDYAPGLGLPWTLNLAWTQRLRLIKGINCNNSDDGANA